jgi:hypothetical protein
MDLKMIQESSTGREYIKNIGRYKSMDCAGCGYQQMVSYCLLMESEIRGGIRRTAPRNPG